MAGLLDNTYLGSIFDDWKKSLQNIDFRPKDDFIGSSLDSDTSPALGAGIEASLQNRKEGSPFLKNPPFSTTMFPPGSGGVVFGDKAYKVIPDKAMDKKGIKQSGVQTIFPEGSKVGTSVRVKQNNKGTIVPVQKEDASKTSTTYQDRIMTGGQGTQEGEIGFMQRLANMTGVDFDKAAATWKDKGGFEGLMSNPAFTMGLAFMAAGAEGKSIGQSSFNSILKAGGISQQYKKIIADRKQAPIQATAADIAETKNLLSKVGISEGNWFENFGSRIKNFMGLGGSKNPGLAYDAAVEEIALQYQIAVRDKQNELKAAGKSQVLRIDDKLKIMEELIASGKIQKSESLFK